jgi:hypothetical protein
MAVTYDRIWCLQDVVVDHLEYYWLHVVAGHVDKATRKRVEKAKKLRNPHSNLLVDSYRWN